MRWQRALRILVVNSGSSSLKLRIIGEGDRVVAHRDFESAGGRLDPGQLAAAIRGMGRIDAVGHRVVHGGSAYSDAVLIDKAVVETLTELAELAPLHQSAALAGIDTVGRVLPDVPAVACFDTTFHQSLPTAAHTYALPADWRQRYGLRRFGFHGLAHRYATRRAAELIGRPVMELRIVSCHLGSGASLAAVQHGRSVDTTMGFTPLEGLVMGSRSGSVDPGLLCWLQLHAGIGIEEIADALERRSGLVGLAGTPDMRTVLERVEAGDGTAILALQVYAHRLRAGIAAMTATLGGLDVLVFTGGVGENAPTVRAAAVERLGFLGIGLDASRNATAIPDADIGGGGAPVRAVVIAAREDLEIARCVRRVLERG